MKYFLFLRNKVIPGTFWSYHVLPYSCIVWNSQHTVQETEPTMTVTSVIALRNPYDQVLMQWMVVYENKERTGSG